MVRTAGAIAQAIQLADGIMGTHFASNVTERDLNLAMRDVGEAASASVWDRNSNVIPDDCEIGSVDDCDDDGVSDACITAGAADGIDDGVCGP